jgi:chromosome segregation ATPase
MKSLLIKSSVQINVVFTNYHLVKKNLLEIMEKVEKYSEGLQTLDRDFSYLSNPSQFPQAYQASLTEIKRRLIFNKKIGKDIERLKQLVVKENINRKQFIQDYGKYLTHDYVPELKITDLKLSIEFNNHEEISNLPNILDEEEESALNSNNIYLDYDEFISQGQEAGNILMSRNNLPNVERSAQLNQGGQVSMRKGSGDSTSMKKNSIPVQHNDYEDQIRSLNAKISELEIVNSIKENEIKKILQKLESRERKITLMQSEFEKLSQTFENLSDNFLKQLSYKDTKLKEKTLENENVLKMLNSQNNNKLENCPMCRDIVTNSIDYQGWGNFVKDYHEKLHEKNKILSKLETRYQELVTQTSFIKKTFFTHLNSVIENKNLEIMSLKQTYENKLMTVEDYLSQERARHDRNEFENKNQVTTQSQNINLLETRLKDLGKLLNSYDVEIKNLKREKENLKKQIEEFKSKENNLLLDIKQKDSKLESLLNDYKSIEKQFDIQKKSINQLSEEIITKVKENTNLKFSVESKSKIIEELEKALENTKLNHIETLNEVHKANQSTIEKLNSKIDEMTQNAQEKLKNSEQYKNLSEEMSQLLNRKDEETKLLNENLNRIKKECEEYKTKYNDLFKLNESYEQETQILKKKMEEIQFSLTEKEKRIQVKTFFYKNYHF